MNFIKLDTTLFHSGKKWKFCKIYKAMEDNLADKLNLRIIDKYVLSDMWYVKGDK